MAHRERTRPTINDELFEKNLWCLIGMRVVKAGRPGADQRDALCDQGLEDVMEAPRSGPPQNRNNHCSESGYGGRERK